MSDAITIMHAATLIRRGARRLENARTDAERREACMEIRDALQLATTAVERAESSAQEES